MDEFCRAYLGSSPWVLFYGSSVEHPWRPLEDGRDVVIQFGPEETKSNISFDRTHWSHLSVMKWLTDRGFHVRTFWSLLAKAWEIEEFLDRVCEQWFMQTAGE